MKNENFLQNLYLDIVQNLVQGRTVYLVSKDEPKSLQVYSFLKDSKVGDLVLNPKESSSLEILKIFEDNSTYDDFHIIEKYVFYYNRLTKFIEQCSKPVFGELHWQEVAEKAVRAQFKYSKEFLTSQLRSNDFEFNRKEYWKIRGRVESFSKLFSTSHIITDSNNLFHDSVYRFPTFEDSKEYTSKQLNAYSLRVYELINEYVSYFGKLRNDFHLEFHENIGLLNNQVLEFRFLLKTQANITEVRSSSLFSFSRKKSDSHLQQYLKQWNQLVYELRKFDLLFHERHQIRDAEELLALCNEALNKLSSVYEQEDSFYNNYLKQLNTHGVSDKILSEMEGKLDALIKELNASSIYKDSIENHSISSLKKFELLKDLQSKLFKGQDQLTRFEGYYGWKSAYILLENKIQDILDVLIYIKPENWVSAFDSWYLSKVAEFAMPKEFSAWKVLYKQWSALQGQVNFDPTEALVATHFIGRIHLFNENKRRNSKLYQQLNQKSEISITSDRLNDFTDEFFPIQFKRDRVVKPSVRCIDIDCIENNSGSKKSLFLRHSVIFKSANRFKENFNDKLKRAESLASIFLANNQKMSLYVSKEGKYLIQLSDWKLDYFISTLNSTSLKRIHFSDFPLERLMEFFLIQEIPTFFIYEDFISGLDMYESIINEEVLRCICDESNIKMISLDSYRLLFGEKSIQSQIESLHESR